MVIAKWTGLTAFVVGAVAFLVGFIGPMIFYPESNQGPLLGIFVTGPLGVVLGAVIGCCIGLFKARRCRAQHGFPVAAEIPFVSQAEAARQPYPYIFVNEDGTVRELHSGERTYLETPFSPFDGARPYVKLDYKARDGWGSIKGYLRRSALPVGFSIAAAPANDPNPAMRGPDSVISVDAAAFQGAQRETGAAHR
jgi:hypothetical protein